MPKQVRDEETGALIFHLTDEEKNIQDLQTKVERMEKLIEEMEEAKKNEG